MAKTCCRSARRLAAAGDADLLRKGIAADGANHDLLANHVARRAVHTHRFGELEILLERGAPFRARHILVELCHIEAGLLGRSQRAGLVGLALTAEQLLVEVEVSLAAGILHA